MRGRYRSWQVAMVIMSTTCVLLPCRPGLADQLSPSSGKSTDKHPNIVLILADDNDQLSWAIGGNCCEFL